MKRTTEQHELVEFALMEKKGPPAWAIRCSCGWRVYYAWTARDGCEAFVNHADLGGYTDDDLEDEWLAGYSEGRTAGDEDEYDLGWEEGRKDLIKTLENLMETLRD